MALLSFLLLIPSTIGGIPIVGPAIRSVAEYFTGRINRRLENAFCYYRNLNALKVQISKLKKGGGAIQARVNAARMKDEDILPDAEDWITRKEKVVEQFEMFFGNENQANERSYSCLSCHALISRYQLSSELERMTGEVENLLETSKFDHISCPALPPAITTTFRRDLEVFRSRESTFQEIMNALENEKVSIMGVYGMAGVGKSTFVDEVAAQAKEKEPFWKIVKTVVNRTKDVKKVQRDIAEMLKLPLEEENELLRAGKLLKRLKQEEKVLIILDDVWEQLDLKRIGIPDGNMDKGCKIILTTRDRQVCVKMNAQPSFLIKQLKADEAWNLFNKTIGGTDYPSDVDVIAAEIVEECGGLPTAIITVANALKGKTERHAWVGALDQLRSGIPTTIPEVLSEVYGPLRFSYNSLGRELKSFFSLCCLFPKDDDIPIESLVRYGWGLKLFQYASIEGARNIACGWVGTLTDRNFLLDGRTKEYIRIHDVVRDFGMYIAQESGKSPWARITVGVEDCSTKDPFDHNTTITLMHNSVHGLPERLNCPELKLLILDCRSPTLMIPSSFFEGMRGLRVLHILCLNIDELPSSIQCLKELRTLCLEHCKLNDISLIRGLHLDILSLSHSIEKLPAEVGEMDHLRLLDLRNHWESCVIPPGIIQRLTQLECLWTGEGTVISLLHSFWLEHFLQKAKIHDEERSNDWIAELSALGNLIDLEIEVPDIQVYPNDLSLQKLERFRISIGEVDFLLEEAEYRKTLILGLDFQPISNLGRGVSMLLGTTQCLILNKIPNLEDLFSDLKTEGFPNLKSLEVKDCDGIQCLASSTESMLTSIFPVLERLSLFYMDDLEHICRNYRLSSTSFRHLREIVVDTCPTLKYLFQTQVAAHLCKLAMLYVGKCENLEEIIATDDEGSSVAVQRHGEIMLPNLKILRLHKLPNLKSFCRQTNNVAFVDAAVHEPLFNGNIMLPTLTEVTIHSPQNIRELWHNKPLTESFSQMRVLKLQNCYSLVKIVPSNSLSLFGKLVKLSVQGCHSVKEILEHEEDSGEKIVLPQLQILELIDLRGLVCFFRGNHILELQSLTEMHLKGCPNMRTFFEGILEAPMLNAIKVENDEQLWRGDLNATVQHIYNTKGSGSKGKDKEEIKVSSQEEEPEIASSSRTGF